MLAGFDAWEHDQSQNFAEILEQQQSLPAKDREFLDGLVGRFLNRHDGNADQCLAALSTISMVRSELERLGNADLQASLGHIGRNHTPDNGDGAPFNQQDQSTLLVPGGGSASLVASDRALNRFRILRPHAKGGLGQVSLALDQDLNREVALKQIQPQYADDQSCRERFVLEAEITGGLEHPGIVPVYALGQASDGRPFYAMRFVKGDSLKEAIEDFHAPNRKHARIRELELRQLLGRFIDVCNAVEFAHSRGVLHRDLKPGNIMVGKYGETLVVDWGLAKVLGKKDVVSEEATLHPSSASSGAGQTEPGSAIGTPAYMSPEQAAGKLEEVGPASDVYSLGATLYHVLCGSPPFGTADRGWIIAKLEGKYPKPRSVLPDVPRALEAICLKAMARSPADRYQSPRALANELELWLADKPVSAMTATLGEQVARWVRDRNSLLNAARGLLALVAAGLFVIFALGAGIARIYFSHHPEQKFKSQMETQSRLRDFEAARLNNHAWLLATAPNQKARNGKQAIVDAIRACELTRWSNAGYISTLAAAYAESGDFDEAEKWQSKAIELATDRDAQNFATRLDFFKSSRPLRIEPDK
ncbi:MAG: protein kinase [Planctomycetia bacterium]|nr:protein kinase [Planctomycetia bacterium]